VAPPVLALAGLGTVLLVLRRKPRTAAQPSTPELSPDDESRFEKDFGSFRRGSE
jgi:hypothetical protein